jgi:hypothetical protein
MSDFQGGIGQVTVDGTQISISGQAAGDIIYYNGTAWVRLAKDAGKYLLSGASAVSWSTVSSSAKSITMSGQTEGVVAITAGVRYVPFAGGAVSVNATETNVQNVCPSACTAKNGRIRILTNGSTSNVAYTLRVNGADTALVITITASTTGIFSDATNTVSVAASDLINWKVGQAATDNISSGFFPSCELDPS